MTPDREYCENIARIWRMIECELDSGEPLPASLRPENQEVTEEIQRASNEIRDAVLCGWHATRIEAREGAAMNPISTMSHGPCWRCGREVLG